MKHLSLILLLALAACTPTRPKPPQPPTPPIEEPPTPPAAGPGVPLAPEMLLRPAPGARVTLRDGQPRDVFMAVQCCRTFQPQGAEVNSRWPLASEAWMDYANGFGANAYHFRLGPFYANTPEVEVEWLDVGGPYIGDGPEFNEPFPEFNEAFWRKAWDLAYHALKLGAHVEVAPIDTWYCKQAQWGNQPMPWPREDIEACGRRPSARQERHLRKAVATLGCLGNVIWSTDVEGDQVQGTKREWYEWVRSVIRDEEQKSGCAFVHMIGTNNTNFADGPFDYVQTHKRAPLTEPIAGKWTINNERNPNFSPEQEASYFKAARDKGLAWAFWRAGMDDDAMVKTLELFRDIAKGESPDTGCFPPPEDDPLWKPGPVKNCTMRPALELAKAKVGDRRHLWPANGTPEQKFEAMFETLELLVAEMRRAGHCAGRSRDSIFVKAADGLWEEMHAVAATDGGYTGQPCKGATWHYGTGSACNGPVPEVVKLSCKDHTEWLDGRRWDCTPKAAAERPIRPEGDPERAACEQQAMGGVPRYSLGGVQGSLALTPHSNPMQFILRGSGSGTLRCAIPARPGVEMCGQVVSL